MCVRLKTLFKLFTDHKALVCIHTQKQTNQMINNGLETLLELNYDVIHRPGLLNILPDALSRIYDADRVSEEEVRIWAIEVPVISQEMELSLGEEETAEHLRQLILSRAHLQGHFGAKSMVSSIIGQGHIG